MITEEEIRANIQHAMRMRNGAEVKRWHKIAEMNGITMKKKPAEKPIQLSQKPVLVFDKVYLE